MTDHPALLYYVGYCRVCATGPLGLRQCGGCGEIVVLCDECDAVWPNADLAADPLPASEDDLPCPHCRESLIDPPSRWAPLAEIEQCDWVAKAIAAGSLMLHKGAAFAPRRNLNLPVDDPATPGDG